MSLAELKLDAYEVGVFEQQLEDLELEVEKLDFGRKNFASGIYVPIQTENKPWAKTYTYRRVTHVGHFQLARNYTNNIPRIDLLCDEVSRRIYKWISGYDYTEDDMLAVVRQGMGIDREKIEGVRESYEQTLNRLIAYGDEEAGMKGFVNNKSVLRSVAPYSLGSSSSTPKQALAVLNDTANAIVSYTNEIEEPDTLLMPTSMRNYYAQLMIETNNGNAIVDKTVLQHFLDTNPYIKNVGGVRELEATNLRKNGLGDRAVMMAYKRDPRKVRAKIYQPLTFLPTKQEGVDGRVRPCKFKFAGVEFKRPYSCHAVEIPDAA